MSNQSLFDSSNSVSAVPLAARMRPQSLSDFFGQEDVVAKGSALHHAIESGDIPSMVLWGPPGTGKTTLAHIIAGQLSAKFLTLSAVTDGVKEVRKVVADAEANQMHGQGTVLFVDEVHRFNKAQQDALLPHIERGTFVFIGATTENPSFELNNALLSRVTVFRLQSLSTDALVAIMQRALNDEPNGLGALKLSLPEKVLSLISDVSNGDARNALNALSMFTLRLQQLADEKSLNDYVTGLTTAELNTLITSTLGESSLHFDKGGDHFYDQISALHKAVRGSSPDAALYWLARMLCAGCDPLYVARRVIRMASEDIGLADPRALRLALDAWETQERLGSPEGELAIAQAVAYMSVAPKSNAVYTAWKSARSLAQQFGAEPVPIHMRNAPTQLMKELGHGEAYRYAHDFPDAYVAGEKYLPESVEKSLAGQAVYQPTDRGLESKIQQRLAHWQMLDKQAGD